MSNPNEGCQVKSKHELPPKAVKKLRLHDPERIKAEYFDIERLDGAKQICKFLGIGKSVFYSRLRWDMDAAGIIFYRPRGCKVRPQLFTYKRLVMNYMIKRRRI